MMARGPKPGTKHKSHKKGFLHKKTYQGMLNLKELFEGRTSPDKGILKDEICSAFYNTPLNKVLKWDGKEMWYKWQGVKRIIRYLMMRDNFPIISTKIPKGTELVDKEYGKRILSRPMHVYFKCVNVSQAGNWRNFCDKIANAVYKTGSKPAEILEEEKVSAKVTKAIQRY
jgi:hypothetical protein